MAARASTRARVRVRASSAVASRARCTSVCARATASATRAARAAVTARRVSSLSRASAARTPRAASRDHCPRTPDTSMGSPRDTPVVHAPKSGKPGNTSRPTVGLPTAGRSPWTRPAAATLSAPRASRTQGALGRRRARDQRVGPHGLRVDERGDDEAEERH